MKIIESYSKVLDLVKQKRLYPYDKCLVLESVIKHFLAKNEFDSWLSGKELVIKSISMFSNFEITLKRKR